MAPGSQSWTGYGDLDGFLDALKEDDDLVEIEEAVSPRFEIGAILRELGERDGPAALFRRIAGFPEKVIVGNVLGHRRRLARALGVPETELTETYLQRKKQRILPVPTTEAPSKEVHVRGEDVDLLSMLPALIHHEKDTSPYLTCAVTFARDPELGYQSMGLHRIQIQSDRSLAICLATPPLARFLSKAQDMAKPLQVAIIVGPDPAVLIASVTWCPEGYDKMEIAGGLRQKPVQVIQCETSDLWVPGHCQYIIEGSVEPGHFGKEGVFGESSGIYVEGVASPIVRVTHVSHRAAPIYQALQTWSSEDEALLNLCFGSDLRENVRKDFPFVRDLYCVPGTVSGHVIVSVNECSTPLLRSAMAAILIRNPFVKMVIAVDEDIDIRNYREVQWAMATRFQGDRDLLLMPGTQGSVIDPSTSPDGSTCKIGMDATFPKDRLSTFQKIDVPLENRIRATEILNTLGSSHEPVG
jgi:2,5-furandicarboxylate decarboxylase 1